MDVATLLGLALAVAAILGTVIMEGGDLASYLSPSATLIIVGGTLAALLVSFPMERVRTLPKVIAKALFAPKQDPVQMIELLVSMVERARREGLLSLEQLADKVPDRFVRSGVLMVVDGFQPEVVRAVMENDIAALEQRHQAGSSMLDAMGGYSPTMGIIGTVLGLVTVLSNLDDPSELGHSIATAFIATLMGVAFANLIWLPLAGKLKLRSKEEVAIRELVLEGLAALQAGENPRAVRAKLQAFLSPTAREAVPKAVKQPQGAVSPEPRTARATG